MTKGLHVVYMVSVFTASRLKTYTTYRLSKRREEELFTFLLFGCFYFLVNETFLEYVNESLCFYSNSFPSLAEI